MNQNKVRILYILKYLSEQTDENHPGTVADIQKYLEKYDIAAERKTVYENLRGLSEFGFDIINNGGKYFYLGSRTFELAELRLLADSVQYSKFITNRKTEELIGKLSSLSSKYEANELKRQVFFRDSLKSMNETVYYNVDTIASAIVSDAKITFKYYEYTLSGKKFRRDGQLYKVSPFTLIVDDENYYLLAYDSEVSELRHYRVDKMESISVTDEKRDGKEAYKNEDMSKYSSKVFGMFKGEETDVRLRFSNYLVNAARDVLGKDLMFIPDGEDHFITHAKVQVSPHFLGWIFALGDGAEILGPKSVRDEMKNLIKKVDGMYEH